MAVKRCYEFKEWYKKCGRKPQKPMTYVDYLRKSDYRFKDMWIKSYTQKKIQPTYDLW
jgi:hypothetical protein